MYSLPVIVVLYSPDRNDCIWALFDKDTAVRTGSGYKMLIPLSQTLKSSRGALDEIAEQVDPVNRQWNSLLVAKNWMKLANENEYLLLEVREWINKSSGRGEFILTAPNGEEITSLNMLGFGLTSYPEVIRRLFPWADVVVDRDFYKAYHGEDSMLEWEHSDPDIYPYRHGAFEVAFYRLKLTVNEVGRSFLVMDDYLGNSNSYMIDSLQHNN